MSDIEEQILDYEKALEDANYKSAHSNMARCYIALSARNRELESEKRLMFSAAEMRVVIGKVEALEQALKEADALSPPLQMKQGGKP